MDAEDGSVASPVQQPSPMVGGSPVLNNVANSDEASVAACGTPTR
jgi:hypothetical protein